jgi:hypothetical protein
MVGVDFALHTRCYETALYEAQVDDRSYGYSTTRRMHTLKSSAKKLRK